MAELTAKENLCDEEITTNNRNSKAETFVCDLAKGHAGPHVSIDVGDTDLFSAPNIKSAPMAEPVTKLTVIWETEETQKNPITE